MAHLMEAMVHISPPFFETIWFSCVGRMYMQDRFRKVVFCQQITSCSVCLCAHECGEDAKLVSEPVTAAGCKTMPSNTPPGRALAPRCHHAPQHVHTITIGHPSRREGDRGRHIILDAHQDELR